MMDMTIEELDYDIEIPDDIFGYDPPEGTDIIVWTPDKEPEDLGPVFGAMFAAHAEAADKGEE